MIQLIMKKGKWRIRITDEVWEFEEADLYDPLNKFSETLDKLIEFKDKYGRLEE